MGVVGKPKNKGKAGRSKSDQEALQQALSGVKPLGRASKKRVMPSVEARPPKGPRSSEPGPPPEPLAVQRDSDGTVLGRRDKAHRSITDALEDPRLEVEAECDLHGMTVREADREVLKFVRDHQARGDRWVLIIAGKGLHSPGGKGTLKQHVVGTLSQRAAARYVLAFRTAPRHLGGSGAFTVRLVDRL